MQEDREGRVLRLLGLGRRGQLVVVGVDMVRRAALSGRLRMAILASDASQHSVAKVEPLLRARRVRMERCGGTAALGEAVGKNATAVIGIVDEQLAKGIRGILDADRA